MRDDYQLTTTPSPAHPAAGVGHQPPTSRRSDPQMMLLWTTLAISLGANGILQASGHIVWGIAAGVITLASAIALGRRHWTRTRR